MTTTWTRIPGGGYSSETEHRSYTAIRSGKNWELTVYAKLPELSGGFPQSAREFSETRATLRECFHRADLYEQALTA